MGIESVKQGWVRRHVATLAAIVLLGSIAACSGSADRGPVAPSSTAAGDVVVVASFNFAESRLLGEIYAQALERAGIPVRRELDLGPRELVLPALEQGFVDVVPEYTGTLLTTLDPTAVATSDTLSVVSSLRDRLAAWRLRALTPAAAQNQNGFAMTRATAERLGVRTLSDLAALAGTMTLTGPAECPARRYCIEGLRDVYGINFERFQPYDAEQERLTALRENVVDVAVVFTTDASLAGDDLRLLVDDREMQPAENVVPVVSDRVLARYPALPETLDAVSAQLSSAVLTFLNWRVQIAGNGVPAEARGWLDRHGL